MATPRKSARTKQIPQRSKEDFFDPKMEFDAPMFHNFGAMSPASTRQDEKMDEWFEMRFYQIQHHLFVEPAYSPITVKNVLASVKSGTLTSRKAKKAVAAADMEAIPKLILEEETGDPGASVAPSLKPAKQTPVAATSKARSSELPVVSALAWLALPAIPVPVASVLQAKPDEKAEGKAAEPQSAVEVPTHSRKRWVKPETPAAKPRAWTPAKAEPTSSTSASSVKSQQTPVASRVLASQTPVASRLLASKTPVASKALTSRTPVASRVLASKTPVASKALTSRTPIEKLVAAKKPPTAPVSPRCYRITRSKTQPAKRSHTEPEQSQPTKRTLTRPQEFSFMSRAQSSKKSKNDAPERKEDEKPPEFFSLLRADSDPAPRQPQGLTEPVEFHFATTTRARTHAMQHSALAGLNSSAAPKVRVEKLRPRVRGMTQPQEFIFATSRRLRARPLPNVPQSHAASKKASVAGKHVTVPQAFNLSKSNRPKQETAPPIETRSRTKLSNKTGAGVTWAPPRKRAPTVPVTPRVATRKRKVPEKVVEEVPKAKPVLEGPRALTVPEPFELMTDLRGAQKAAHLQMQVVEELQREQEAREFVARPLPPDGPSGIPAVEPPPLTIFEPFALQSEALSLLAKQKLEEKVLMEQALDNEMRKFRANVPLSLKRAPFRPLTSNRPLTVADTPGLKSTTRAQERAEFSVEKNCRIVLKEKREMQAKAMEEESEQEEIRKLRETLVFKATPFVNPSPVRLVLNSHRPTVAKSPVLLTSLRSMR